MGTLQNSLGIIIAAAVMITGAIDVMAIEEAQYSVVRKDDRFEVRDYAPHIQAETLVDGDLESAGSKAFNKLFRYISGANQSRAKVAMTAPVSQEAKGEKIQMTAPVGQQRNQEGWIVSFMMPASYSMETLPKPDAPEVTLRLVPARRMAVVRYSGFWSEQNYLRYKRELESWINQRGLVILGDPIWARYNPPFTPWFMRRNEILIQVDSVSEQ